jgi:hypothetical protein
MRQVTRISPANSIVFVHGGPGHVPPLPIWGAQVLATNSCVSVACCPEVDGPTEIVFGDVTDAGLDRPPDFAGILRTPDRQVTVTTVDNHPVLSMPVAATLTGLKVWRSEPRWPQIVRIAIETLPDIDAAKRAVLASEQATRTRLELPPKASGIFLSDNPRARGDFNPWLSPDFLQTGILLPLRNPIVLTVKTGLLHGPSRPPDLDAVLTTPGKEVWIFPDHQKVLLKIQREQNRTRLRAWIEHAAGRENVTLLVQ